MANMKAYLKKQFLEELAKRGVQIGYKALLKYEKNGIVPRPEGNWRLYSEEDIETYANAIKKYRESPKTTS